MRSLTSTQPLDSVLQRTIVIFFRLEITVFRTLRQITSHKGGKIAEKSYEVPKLHLLPCAEAFLYSIFTLEMKVSSHER